MIFTMTFETNDTQHTLSLPSIQAALRPLARDIEAISFQVTEPGFAAAEEAPRG